MIYTSEENNRKLYEGERRKLYEDSLEETQEYYLAEEKEIKEKGHSRDSQAGYNHQIYHQEYIRKLKELKNKYKIE